MESSCEGRDGVRWYGVVDVAPLHQEARPRILDAAARSIHERRRFQVVRAGGETPHTRWRAGEDLPAAAIRPAGGVDVLITTSLLSPGQ